MFLFDFSHRSVKVSPEVRVLSMLSRDGHCLFLTFGHGSFAERAAVRRR